LRVPPCHFEPMERVSSDPNGSRKDKGAVFFPVFLRLTIHTSAQNVRAAEERHAAPRKLRVRDKRAVLPSSSVGYTAYEMWYENPYCLASTLIKTKRTPHPDFPIRSYKEICPRKLLCVFGQGLLCRAPTFGTSFISFELGAAELVEDRIANCSGLHGIRAGHCHIIL
jgi:hypothetical protein